jgi:hypothetical protein
MHSIAFNHIQCSLKGIQKHSSVSDRVQLHSIRFNCIQYLLKGIHMHSSEFSGGHKGIQSSQITKGPMDMCLNMQSIRKPHRFAPNVRWMFINVPWLDLRTRCYLPKEEWCQVSILGRDFDENEIGDEKYEVWYLLIIRQSMYSTRNKYLSNQFSRFMQLLHHLPGAPTGMIKYPLFSTDFMSHTYLYHLPWNKDVPIGAPPDISVVVSQRGKIHPLSALDASKVQWWNWDSAIMGSSIYTFIIKKLQYTYSLILHVNICVHVVRWFCIF